MTDVNLSVIRRPRKRTLTVTTTTAGIEIPEWARNGGGILYFTGVGGGGGGASSGGNGSGGTGAEAHRHPVLLLSGTSTLNVTIGAGGAAASNGGTTVLSIGGVNVIELGGGEPGYGYGGRGGLPKLFTLNYGLQRIISGTGSVNVSYLSDLAADVINRAGTFLTLREGTRGASGTNPLNIYSEVMSSSSSARTPSSFGGGSGNTNYGYGYGGKAEGNFYSAPGGAGLAILEFEELPND